MIAGPKLTPKQWKLLASAFSNMGQAIILFSLAVIFVPEAVGLSNEYPKLFGVCYLISGLLLLRMSVIIANNG